MAKVNPEDLVEFECPRYNEDRMKRNGLESSPGLKISVFLGEVSLKRYHDNVMTSKDTQTVIQCAGLQKTVCPYSGSPCLYSDLSRKVSKKD